MDTINQSIYNQMKAIAHKLVDDGHIKFNQDGTFTTAEMARNTTTIEKVKQTIYTWEGTTEPIHLTAGTFTCNFISDKIFSMLYAFQRLCGIPQKEYEHFHKATEEEPILCEFTVPKDVENLVKACADDALRPQMCGVYLDTERRCLVASDGLVLRVVALPDLTMWRDIPKKKYTEHSGMEPLHIILNRKLIKAGAHITVTPTKADDGKRWENHIEGRYPNWKSVFYEVGDNNCINITGCMKDIQKAVKALDKVMFSSQKVVLSGEQGSNELHISMADELDSTARQEKVVMLPEPCKFRFVMAYLPDKLSQMSDADFLYYENHDRMTTFAKEGSVQLIVPRKLYEDATPDEARVNFYVVPENPFSPLDRYLNVTTTTEPNQPSKPKKTKKDDHFRDLTKKVEPTSEPDNTVVNTLHYAHRLFLFFQFMQQQLRNVA